MGSRKLKAFTLIELMMILLVASLIIAALFPVITKKHFRLPELANHGSYLCYYQDGKLYEAEWAGKAQQREIIAPHEVANCSFVAPKKASFFQISVIGGGGGGGDAGYTGPIVANQNSTQKISPFGITQNVLDNLKMKLSEFNSYAGTLIGYARGAASTSGGKIGYVEGTEGTVCRKYKDPIGPIPEYAGSCYSWVDGKCRNTGRCYTAYNCTTLSSSGEATCIKYVPITTKRKSDTKTKYIGDDCSKTEKAHYECNIYSDLCGTVLKTRQNCDNIDEGTLVVNIDYNAGMVDPCSAKTVYKDKTHVPEQKICTPIYDYDDITTTEWVCADDPRLPDGERLSSSEARGGAGATYHYSCTGTGHLASDLDVSEEECKSYVGPKLRDYYTDHCGNEINSSNFDYSACAANCEDPVSSKSYNLKCMGADAPYSAYQPGGAEAFCKSKEISGQLNLTNPLSYSALNRDSIKSMQAGVDKDWSSGMLMYGYFGFKNTTDDGMSYCLNSDGEGVFTYDCNAEGYTPAYSEYIIRNSSGDEVTVKALSARRAGSGAERDVITDENGEKIDSASMLHNQTAIAGSCEGAGAQSVASVDALCDGIESNETSATIVDTDYRGYCLKSPLTSGKFKKNGTYQYSIDAQRASLTKGASGNPGEYRTIILRSLKGVDTTIKVGRGGSGAPLDSGAAGAAGSQSSFGTILTAKGGTGGNGKLTDFTEGLSAFDKDIYEQERNCYFHDKADLKDDTGNWIFPAVHEAWAGHSYDSAACDALRDASGNYKYFRLSNKNTMVLAPSPTGVFSTFLNIALSAATGSSADAITIFKNAGRGGKGGAVEHINWAGYYYRKFEGKYLESSVFESSAKRDSFIADTTHPEVTEETSKEKYVRSHAQLCSEFYSGWSATAFPFCASGGADYTNIPAGSGSDGAVLIKW